MGANRWRRFADWDERPLRLDRFAVEDAENGFAAFHSPHDPKPGIGIADGRVVSLDGVAEADFDMIDIFVARYHIDPAVAPEAMAMPSPQIARMLVDMNVPRTELTRLAHGMTPAKLAEVVAELNAMEIAFAYSKMRARRTPGNQGHVTNAKDDPLQLAADAAIAVGLGFDEIETTMRVSRNAWSNAVACCVGASVGRAGTLFQCASEEAEELKIGMAGFTSYAETVSVYGTEHAFMDGDDTPWSKAFLATAYASRGIKMRCTSGAGSELLMGFHESKSLLYLEARCLCLQRAMGVQGTQNGGIDGAPVTATVPGGIRELMAENLIAVWLDLECASGNDARSTESEIRVGAKILPYLIGGSDLICSGFGTILKYDNSFNPSLLNGEELEDYLVLQRDFEADGGLTPIGEERALEQGVECCFIVAVGEIDRVIDQLDRHVRILLAHLFQRFGDRFGDGHFTGPLGAEDGEGHHRVAVEAREGAGLLIGVGDGAEFRKAHETVIRQRDHRVCQLLDRAGVAEGADRLLGAGDLAATGAGIRVHAADLTVHVGGSNAEGVELVGVEVDAHLAVGAAEAVDLTDAGPALQRTLDLVVDEPG